MPTTVGTPATAKAKTPATAAAETPATAAKAAVHPKCSKDACNSRDAPSTDGMLATPVTQQEQGWKQLVRFRGIYDQIVKMANIR